MLLTVVLPAGRIAAGMGRIRDAIHLDVISNSIAVCLECDAG